MIRAALGVVGVLVLLAVGWYFYHASGSASSTSASNGNNGVASTAESPRNSLGLPPLPGFDTNSNPSNNNTANNTSGTSGQGAGWNNPAPVNPDNPTAYANPGEDTHQVVHSAGGTLDRPFNPAAIEPAPVPVRATSYTVQSGDSLWSISKKQYGSSKYIEQIAQANGMSSKTGLKIGQTLTIPEMKSNVRPPIPAHERDADCENENATPRHTQQTATAAPTHTPANMPPTLSHPVRVDQPRR